MVVGAEMVALLIGVRIQKFQVNALNTCAVATLTLAARVGGGGGGGGNDG